MTDLLQFTINVPKPHRQSQCTLQLVCEDRVLSCCSSELIFAFFNAASSIQNAREQFVWCIYHPSLVNFALHPTKQTNLTELGQETQTALSR